MILSTYLLFFPVSLSWPSLCHYSLGMLAPFSNYLSLINFVYLASVLANFLKSIKINNRILITNCMFCSLLLSLLISLCPQTSFFLYSFFGSLSHYHGLLQDWNSVGISRKQPYIYLTYDSIYTLLNISSRICCLRKNPWLPRQF